MILCLFAFLTLVSAGTEDLIGSWFDQATDDDDVVEVSRFVASKLGYTLAEVERAQIQDLVRYFIMLTCPCSVDPQTSHFYIVKLGFTGVYISFSLHPTFI